MKNKLFLWLLIPLTMCFYHCDTRLNPIDQVPKERGFQSAQDVRLAYLNCFRTGVNQFLGTTSYLTDNTRVCVNTLGNGITLFTWQYTAHDGFGWSNRYRAIDDINRTLQAAAKLLDSDPSESAELKALIAQLHGIRAYAYWDLLNRFSRIQQPQSLGVALKTEKHIDIFETPPRASVQEVLDFIQADIAIAAQGMPANVPIDEFNRGALTALEARIALETGDFDAAIAKAGELIDRYPLANRTEFSQVWMDQSNTGVIMKKTYTENYGKIGNTWQQHEPKGDQINFNPSVELLKLYTDDDIRKDVYFKIVGLEKQADINKNQIVKYPGKSPELKYLSDAKLVRVAEMYFIRAEAQAKNGDWGGAAQDVNAIRQARMENPTDWDFSSLSQKQAIEKILEEKRREMCYEGTRWFDLKRNGLPITRGEQDRFKQGKPVLPAHDYRWLFPIPQSEIFANDNMKQNPGY